MNISLRQIEIFLAVAKTLSFSHAARLCHLSQPALSANVKRLEEAIGARLFDRHTRKVSMSVVGEQFFSVATVLTENVDLAMVRVQEFVAGKRGRLVIAAAPSIAASFVPDVIAEFAQVYPDIRIELHDKLSDVCVEMVRSRFADVALAPLKTGAVDLDQLELFPDHLVAIWRAGHPLGKRRTIRWRDIYPYPHVVMNRSSSVRQLIDAEYHRDGVVLRPAFEVEHVGTMLGLIAAGLGVGELPESLIRNINMSGLAHRRISNTAAHRTICATTVRHRSHAPPLAPFVEACQRHAKRRLAESRH